MKIDGDRLVDYIQSRISMQEYLKNMFPTLKEFYDLRIEVFKEVAQTVKEMSK